MELKVYRSKSPVAGLVVAHGAGGGQNTGFMVRTAEGLASRGIVAATFDFAYMSAGKSVPDKAPVLEQAWRDALERARVEMPASQGSPGLAGLVFLGYPLHPPGKPDQRRDAHLPAIAEPMLFVQGSRDAFGTPDEIRSLLPRLQHATLHEVPGGDHSFKVSGRGAPKPDAVLGGILDVVKDWIAERA